MSGDPVKTICLVEDDVIMGESLVYRFELEGLTCDWHQTAEAALKKIGHKDYSVLISDIRLPDMSGTDMYHQLLQRDHPVPPTIFVTGFGNVRDAVALIKKGAVDYITKPFDLDTLVEKIDRLCGGPEQKVDISKPVLGVSSTMHEIERALCQISGHDATVLITGESGVGKEHAANHLHCYSDDSTEKPFIAINCGAITESLMESELFGHEKGAFTGAVQQKRGVFERADGGTLFLDEIGEMPLTMQVKLLRVIQERQIIRIGGETVIPVNVRLICATNRDLKAMVSEGTFREDLFYRINVIHVVMPPLRERPEDILWFARLFIKELQSDNNNRRYLLPSAEDALLAHNWPGNLRELHHRIERACILTASDGLSEDDFDTLSSSDHLQSKRHPTELKERLSHFEQQLISEALERNDYQINATADELGISRKSLWQKMKKMGIKRQHE